MKIKAMNGFKLFKEKEDGNIEMIRIIKVNEDKKGFATVTIRDEQTKNIRTITKKNELEELSSYTPLEPDAVITFSVVKIDEYINDVIITASKFLNVKIGDTRPHIICRQCINDFFYESIYGPKDQDKMQYGISVSQDTCPTNIDFDLILGCKDISYSCFLNFYRNDTLESLLNMIPLLRFNRVLINLFEAHMESLSTPIMNKNLKEHQGWCKDIETLLKVNNFEYDLNTMLGITKVDFDLEQYITKTDKEYDTIVDNLKIWLSVTFDIGINSVAILKYDHDIDLAQYKNTKYLLLRDSKDNLYMIIYTEDKEYFESDLYKEASKIDFSESFRINFYNKYNKNNK